MGQEYHPIPSVILIAPNVSEKMGGEAIKSLQIYHFLVDRGVDVHQITHSRVREELSHSFPDMKVIYIEETWLDFFLWKTKFFSYLITPYFMYRAAQIARKLVAANPDSVVHYTSPISPVTPMFPIPEARVVVGPLNGNIHHPLGFRARESRLEMFRRLGMFPCQCLHRLFFSGKQTADVILVAGGQRTYRSLKIAGCRDEQFHETLDSGIPDYLSETPPILHRGVNYRFVHHGRLVAYKGADLAIKAVARARCPVELHVIGDGKERRRLEKLAARLGISDRVHFTGWMKHEDLIEDLRGYRAMVTPTLAEANGIVFQEAMMIGLPVVCLDWGGPSLLVTPETGFLIAPRNEAQIIDDLADRMDLLAEDGDLANQMALKSRQVAMDRGYCWSQLIERWISIYCELDLRSRSLSLKDTRPNPVVLSVEGIRTRILALIFFGNDRQSRPLESKSEEIEFAP